MMNGNKLLALGASVVLASAGISHAAQSFTDSSVVNLLERWNPNGTYNPAVSGTNSANLPRATVYHMDGAGWFGVNNGTADGAHGSISARFTFDTPKTISTVSWNLRPNEAPMEIVVSDNTGQITDMNVSPGYLTSASRVTYSFAPRVASYIDFAFPNVSTVDHFMHATQFGAYQPASVPLRMDGTYNVFYNENPAPTGFDSTLWTDHISDRLSPGNANSTTWHFAQDYQFTGAYLTHENDTINLNSAKIEVSSDGVTYTTVYGPTNFSTGYMVFSQQLFGSYARLSWANSGIGGGAEINEFQLFVFVPEPTSIALVGLVGVPILMRRRGR